MKRSNQTKLTFLIGPKTKKDRQEMITPYHPLEEGNLATNGEVVEPSSNGDGRDRWPYEDLEEEHEPHVVEIIPPSSQTEDFKRTRERSRELLDQWFYDEKDLSDVTHSLYSPYFSRSGGPIIDEEVYRRGPRKKRVPILRYIASIGGAVLTGFLMGLALLSFFVEDGELGKMYSYIGGETVNTPSSEGNASTAGKEDSGASSPATYPIPVQWSAQPYYMVQAGVFADDVGAEKMIESLNSQGYPSILLPTSKDFRVYVGTAGTKEDAVLVATHYKEQGIDVFVKDFAIPSAEQIELVNGDVDPELISTFLTDGDRLYKQLSHWQSGVLTGVETDVAPLKPELQQWMSQLSGFREALAPEIQLQVDQMVIHMKEAVALQEDYQKDPVVTHVWRSQGELMSYIVTTQKWVQSLSRASSATN
jgi:hypothetical protein